MTYKVLGGSAVVLAIVFGLFFAGTGGMRDAGPNSGVPSEVSDAMQEHTASTTVMNEKIVYLKSVPGDVSLTGTVATASLHSKNTPAVSSLVCSRVHYAGDVGICLAYDPASLAIKSHLTKAVFFDKEMREQFHLSFPGIPSRTRVSPDGNYAAVTTFVTGDSYASNNFSTRSAIIDIRSRKVLADLEEYEVWKGGERIKKIDFNFWGVTFVPSTDTFYATLKYDGIPRLVKGDMSEKKVEVLRDHVECPSLSPDGTKIAFKKAVDYAFWRIAILDVHTGKEIELGERMSVDDQIEWLTPEVVLYAVLDAGTFTWRTLQARADGTGSPAVFLVNAFSPSVTRQEAR